MSNPCFFMTIENKTQRPIKITGVSSDDWQDGDVGNNPEINPGAVRDIRSVSDVNTHWGDSYRRLKVSYVDGPKIGEFQLGTDDASFGDYTHYKKSCNSDDYTLKAGSSTELINIIDISGRGDSGDCSLSISVCQDTPPIVSANNIAISFENKTDSVFVFTPGDKLGLPLCADAIKSCGTDLTIGKRKSYWKSTTAGPISYNTDRSTSGLTWGALPGILREIKKNCSTLLSFRIANTPNYDQELKWVKSMTLLKLGAKAGVDIRSWLIDVKGHADIDAVLKLNINDLIMPIGKNTSGTEEFKQSGETYKCNLQFEFAALEIPKIKLVDLIFGRDFSLKLKEGTKWNNDDNSINTAVTIIIEDA